jgi:pimeloyl-ACP methyl ester carboxylesterase
MKTISALAALAVPTLLLASCTGDPGSGNEAQNSPTTRAPSASTSVSTPSYEEPWLDELVPVGGGRRLHTTCWGHGSPAVVTLHGLIMPYDDASWAHSPDDRALIAPHTTYCEYERVNVGTSSIEKGPIPLTESAADLNALLDGIGIVDPVVLLAGSHGGLLGTLFAGTYPARLAGIVLRDPSLAAPPELPGCPDTNIDKYVPAQYRLKPDSWKDNAERSDHFRAYALVSRVLDNIPKVPGVLFAATQDNYPPGTRVKPFMRCLREMQRSLAGRFQPGRMVVLHAGHGLEGYRNRIDAAVLRIVDSYAADN